jgi:hypothetical protein
LRSNEALEPSKKSLHDRGHNASWQSRDVALAQAGLHVAPSSSRPTLDIQRASNFAPLRVQITTE